MADTGNRVTAEAFEALRIEVASLSRRLRRLEDASNTPQVASRNETRRCSGLSEPDRDLQRTKALWKYYQKKWATEAESERQRDPEAAIRYWQRQEEEREYLRSIGLEP